MDFIPYISFLTGVASIISPCIIPVIPILFGFALKNRENKEIFAFILGLFSIFTALIFITAFFTVMFYSYIPYVRLVSAVILFAVGLLFLFNRTFSMAFEGGSREGLAGSFVLGMLTSLAWSPCYGGYLISLISVLITTAEVLYISMNIVLYTLGFGLTLLVLGYVISKVNIERFIKKSEYVRRISGVLFILGAIYMLTTVGAIL